MGTRIRAVALDVDGVMTDGTVWLGPSGEEYKATSFLDIMGVSRATRAGVVFAFISGEDTPFVRALAKRLNVTDVWLGCREKASALREFAARHDLALTEVAFMGDDINDVEAMALAGFAAAPSAAHQTALRAASFIPERPAGRGAVRDVLDHLADSDWLVELEESR